MPVLLIDLPAGRVSLLIQDLNTNDRFLRWHPPFPDQLLLWRYFDQMVTALIETDGAVAIGQSHHGVSLGHIYAWQVLDDANRFPVGIKLANHVVA